MRVQHQNPLNGKRTRLYQYERATAPPRRRHECVFETAPRHSYRDFGPLEFEIRITRQVSPTCSRQWMNDYFGKGMEEIYETPPRCTRRRSHFDPGCPQELAGAGV